MPLITYACECAHSEKKFFRRSADAPPVIPCKMCNRVMKKSLSSPSSSSKITVDNGVQARAVEITPNIIEINQERASKNYRED